MRTRRSEARRTRRARALGASWVLAVLGSGACSPMNVGTIHAPGIRFAEGSTYSWRDASQPGEEYPALRGAEVSSAIRGAVDAQLQARGFVLTEAPEVDYYVDFHLSAREEAEVVTEFHADTGWEEPVAVFEFTTGTLIVDLVTAQNDEVVWRGWAVGEVSDPPFAWVEGRVCQAVEEMFEKFPD